MAKTKSPKPQIIQGGINISGNVKFTNSKIAGRDSIEKINVNISFAPVYQAIRKKKGINPNTKRTLEENVKQIEQEIKKGDEAKATFVQKRLENIQKMAPDIAEVAIATLQNPTVGISLAVKKVIDRSKNKST